MTEHRIPAAIPADTGIPQPQPGEAALPSLAAPDQDPRLWLEEVEGPAALAWTDAQSAKTLARYIGPGFEADRSALRAILDRPDRIPHITRRGQHLYNYWQDATNPRGLWRRTSMESYQSGAPEWQVVLNLDSLAEADGADWVWHGATTLPGRHDRAILNLSRGGGDAVVLREYDIESQNFPADGFSLPEAKSSVDWLDRDTLLLASAHGEGMATRAGYARTIRLWRRGEDPAAAPILFETAEENMAVGAGVDREGGAERVVYVEQLGFFESHLHLGDRGGPKQRIDIPADAGCQWQGGWLAIRPRSPWVVGEITFAPDTLLGIGLDAYLAGSRTLHTLFTPAPRRALQGFFWCHGRLILSVLEELEPHFPCFTPSPSQWSEGAVGGLPSLGVVNLWPLDAEAEESDGTLLAMAQDPLTPASLLLLPPPEKGTTPAAPLVLQRAPAVFVAEGLVARRHEAVSVDGERIPYVQVGPEGPETGDAPVHMTGYGGFRIPILPGYAGSSGKLWLERGGTTVTASIRGGGEFGTAWHAAGRREGKFLSHEDFAAVAADLVRRGVTRPQRIAAEGGSNGGLLIANMLVRHPDKFGALLCTIPLVDMRRYTLLLAGASWIDEYGDPAKPEDWAFLQRISAYHTAEAGKPYPPILLATTRRDDRVHPGHARKMAAKLQALGYAAEFYEPAAGGHGYGKDSSERAHFMALGATFLRRNIGWHTAEDELAAAQA